MGKLTNVGFYAFLLGAVILDIIFISQAGNFNTEEFAVLSWDPGLIIKILLIPALVFLIPSAIKLMERFKLSGILKSFLIKIKGDKPSWLSRDFEKATKDRNGIKIVFLFISACAIGPVLEEFIFRFLAYGYVSSFISMNFEGGFRVVLLCVLGLLSVVVFSLLHQTAHFINILVTGLCFLIAYIVTGDIWFAIAMHIVLNSLAMLGQLLKPYAEKMKSSQTGSSKEEQLKG